MTRRCTPLPTCPDCGGILQPVDAERLTSAEVASPEEARDTRSRQCLICGYVAPATADAAPVS